MDFGKLFPNSTKNKDDDNLNILLYTALVDWGWSYEQFINTPIVIINRLLKVHNKVNKKKKR